MPRVTRNAFLKAFADKPEVASRLSKAIDALGAGKSKSDGVLSEAEIKQALALATSDAFDGVDLRKNFQQLFGRDFDANITDPASFQQRVLTELGAQSITAKDLVADMTPLCKDPALSIRDATTPGYAKSAEWVARELAKAGAKPLGDPIDGKPSFFQGFRWENRFETGTVNKSSNVVGLIPGNGKQPREAVVLIAHLDNLSAAEKAWYRSNEGVDLSHYEGANDNASAVAALLEVARGLKASGKTERDVILLVPSAEEDGLKGTEAFVRNPPVPLDRIIGAVNLEMLGCNAPEEILVFGGDNEIEARSNPLYIRAQSVSAIDGLPAKPGDENDDGQGWWKRSDHLVTANAGIPSIMFHGRAAPGNYHTANDTLENLDPKKIEHIARDVLRVLRDLANDPNPPEKRKAPKPVLNPYPGKVWIGDE